MAVDQCSPRAEREPFAPDEGPAARAGHDLPHLASERGREQVLESSFDAIVETGRQRMRRSWLDLLATGTVGGIEVAFGILAMLAVDQHTGSTLLGAVAFSVGFIALLLGHSELFTEGFLVPVTVVAAGEVKLRRLLRLWVGSLAGNLLGGLIMAAVTDQAFPELHHQAVVVAASYVVHPLDLQTFCLALLGGGAITLLTRMHHGTDNVVAKIVASVSVAFLLAGVHLYHSVLDSLLAFTALLTGSAPFGWLDWLGWFGFVVLGNVVGGLLLTTMLRIIRSRQRVADYRIANDRPVPHRTAAPRERDSTPQPF
jgi:formate/nitrite transporter FocA (FNT family)